MYACSSPSGTEEPCSADTGELWLHVYTGIVLECLAKCSSELSQLGQATIKLLGSTDHSGCRCHVEYSDVWSVRYLFVPYAVETFGPETRWMPTACKSERKDLLDLRRRQSERFCSGESFGPSLALGQFSHASKIWNRVLWLKRRLCAVCRQRELASVSFDSWTNLPEVGDARNKRQRNPRLEKSASFCVSFFSLQFFCSRPTPFLWFFGSMPISK